MAPCADKIASWLQVLGEHDNNVKAMLNEFGVALKPSSFKKDVQPLLKEACTAIFGTAAGAVDMMVKNFPSSKAGSAIKVSRTPAQPCTLLPQQSTRACAAQVTVHKLVPFPVSSKAFCDMLLSRYCAYRLHSSAAWGHTRLSIATADSLF